MSDFFGLPAEAVFKWANEVCCKYCHQTFFEAKMARECEARHEARMKEWEEQAKLVRIKQVLMYTHPESPIPFLWDVADVDEFTKAMWELFYFLEEKGCYQELSDEGLEAQRSNIASLEELEHLLAEGNGIPAALLNEAHYKVTKFLPDAKMTVERLAIEALLYKMIIEDHSDGALLKFMDLRKELPNETWLMLKVLTPSGTEPAKPAERVKPKYLLVTTEGTEVPWACPHIHVTAGACDACGAEDVQSAVEAQGEISP